LRAPLDWRYATLLTLVLAAAAFLRFYRLDTLPLGFHHDEALDSIAALEIWTKGQHPIFFPQQGSREPLMIYLESLGVLALGATRLGARIAQACVGTAGVVVCWWLARELYGRRVALLAAACMGFSFWDMFESRLGLRAISQPLVEGLCLLFFWRTLTRRGWCDALLAGAFLGLSLYTYTAGRALPLLFVAIALWQAFAAPSFVAKQWRRMLLIAGAALAVFAPLGLYALSRPQDFFGRSLQVNLLSPEPFTGAAVSGGIAEAVIKTLGMFSVAGDPAWKYNIGGQPVFDWPMSALFYGGILLALLTVAAYLRTPRAERPPASPGAGRLLWLVIMMLPGLLSGEAPHFLRTIGVLAGLVVLPALALCGLNDRRGCAAPAAAAVIAFEAGETGYRYFVEWAHSPEAYYAMQTEAADVAFYLRGLPSQEPVLFSSEYPGHPTLLYLAPAKFESIRWFNGREGMAFPPPGRPYLYVFTAHYRPGFLDLGSLFRPEQLLAEGHDPAGGVAWQVYQGSPAAPAPRVRLSAQLGELAQLEGASAPSAVQAGSTLEVQELWRALRAGTPDIRAFLHLVDEQGHLWAQADNIGYYAEDWQPGDTAMNDQRLDVPAYAPPLPMRLLFGLYSSGSGQELPARDAAGAPAGSQVDLGMVQVQPGSPPPAGWRPPNALQRPLTPGLTLAGYSLPQTTVRAGDSLPVDLYWRVDARLTAVPPLQLGDSSAAPADPPAAASQTAGAASASQSEEGAGQVLAQAGALRERGLADLLAPGEWPDGVIEDRRELLLPAAAPSGRLELSIGGVRLGEITVTAPKREFATPSMERELDLPVDGFATLAGYTLAPLEAGQPLRLTLFWQDRTATATSWKVFVHVLDGANHVLAQQDALPAAGQAPTTSWVPGQVVADRYEVALPGPLPAGAQLEVGMYEPVSGKRLAIGPQDHVLLPLSGR
jgi:hypothetical protein